MKLEEARVLLVGASGGIGQAMASALHRAGAMVMGVGRSEAPPISMPWVQADLVSEAGVAAVADAAQQRKINVVVIAAGVSAFGALSQVNAAQMRTALDVNLLAPMLLTQALLPALMAQPRAQLIFVGSVLGRIGLPGFSVYGASKAGLHGFAEGLRRECADPRLRIQILGPRSTRTTFNAPPVEAYQRATKTAVDEPEVVAAALLRLIENEAAERFLGFPERLALRLNGLLGAWFDGVFARHRRSLTQTADKGSSGPSRSSQ